MIRGKKVVVVMPAYNAARTLRRTYDEVIEQGIVDRVIVVDDASRDETVAVARELPTASRSSSTSETWGYGGNQKTCYRPALAEGADIVIMVHPDYQYTPKLIPAMASIIGNGIYPCVLGCRILGGYALRGGMPLWKYVANRVLTFAENVLHGRQALRVPHGLPRLLPASSWRRSPLDDNSDDFVFDNQMLAQILWVGVHHRRGELPDEVLPRGLLDQPPPEHPLRARLRRHGRRFPDGTDGARFVAPVPARAALE